MEFCFPSNYDSLSATNFVRVKHKDFEAAISQFLFFNLLIFTPTHPSTHSITSYLALTCLCKCFCWGVKGFYVIIPNGPSLTWFLSSLHHSLYNISWKNCCLGFHGNTLSLFIINSPNVPFAFTASCSWTLKYHPVPKHHLSTFLLYLNSSSHLLTHSFS